LEQIMSGKKVSCYSIVRASICRNAVPALLTIGMVMAASAPKLAHALIVGTTPGVVPDTSVNSASFGPSWTGGDPGWANAGRTSTSLNAVYIGDGWVISAYHTGVAAVQFVDNGPLYQPIPNQNFKVPNPAGVSGSADLRLYRINSDPGLPSIPLATQPLALDDEVMTMSYGVYRFPTEFHWNVDDSTNPPTWTSVASGGTYSGYDIGGGGKRWGTNQIADDNAVTGESDADLTTVVMDGFGNTISSLTVYDQNSSNPFESQVVGGDSGSGVFHKRNGQWELAGIVIDNFTWDGQTTSTFNPNNSLAVYGNASAFADLASYATQIAAIKAAHVDYSIMGDINLDGVVNNNDVNALVTNWRYDSGSALGSLTSWTHGDLNHDGKTDVSDFFLLRNALNGVIPGGALAALFGDSPPPSTSGSVPEPTTAGLALLAGLSLFALRGKRRTPRCVRGS
jgi:hypothetical protein